VSKDRQPKPAAAADPQGRLEAIVKRRFSTIVNDLDYCTFKTQRGSADAMLARGADL